MDAPVNRPTVTSVGNGPMPCNACGANLNIAKSTKDPTRGHRPSQNARTAVLVLCSDQIERMLPLHHGATPIGGMVERGDNDMAEWHEEKSDEFFISLILMRRKSPRFQWNFMGSSAPRT